MAAPGSPRLSVCIPNYNHGRYLAEAIDSVCRQSYPAHEVLVLDDCSTDDSIDVVKACMTRYANLRYCQYPEKSADWLQAMTERLPMLNGDYVLLLGADDYLYPGFFTKAAAAIDQHPQVGAVFGDFDMVSASGQLLTHVTSGLEANTYLAGPAMERQLCKARMFETGIAALIRRDALIWLVEQGIGGLGPAMDGVGYAVAALRWGACYLTGPQGAFRMAGARNYNQGVLGNAAEFQRHYAEVARFLRRDEIARHLPARVVAALERRLLGTVPLGGSAGLRVAHWLWSRRESRWAIVRGGSAIAIKTLRWFAAAMAPALTRWRHLHASRAEHQ